MGKLEDLLAKSVKSPGFIKFWSHTTNTYGARGSQRLAHKEWEYIGLEGCEDELIDIYNKQVQHKRNAQSSGDFEAPFQHICRWLRNHRWEDDLGDEEAPVSALPTPQEAQEAFRMLKGGK